VPWIPGLTYKGFLGTGGFADVYLYESTSPVRDVAVKVLHPRVMNQQQKKRFSDEANTMAALEHPYIVRVYSSGETVDGRPYIEMAYYPNPNLAQTVAHQTLSVPAVLRLGVQLASAIEAAHQVGLLHRDIKPANVLIDRFGDPALSDFGVASFLYRADEAEASLSVPWAPPEAIFSTAPLDPRCDIYSLAATLWHLLVGHSPFEVPGGDNRANAMMTRVRDLPLPSTGRGDVPASLERLLRQAMSKEARQRPASAQGFAQVLNTIEEELRLRPTEFKIARSPVGKAEPIVSLADGNETRVQAEAGDLDGAAQKYPRPYVADNLPHGHVKRIPKLDETHVRSPLNPEVGVPIKRFRLRMFLSLFVTIAVVAGVAFWIILGPKPEEFVDNPYAPSVPPDTLEPNQFPNTVACRPNIHYVINPDDETITFSWDYCRSHSLDYYMVAEGPSLDELNQEWKQFASQKTIPYQGAPICISIRVVRGNGTNPQLDPTAECSS
jgi:serine/threonine protein kinase